MTDPALRVAVGTLPPGVRRVADYHFGWCDPEGNPASGASGKAIRPALALLTAVAGGGAWGPALPAAVAVELVHNHSLLHDDVMDGDVVRRHRPTAWSVFGVGPAILAGDALLALAFDLLATSGSQRSQEAVHMLGVTTQRLLAGQMADVAFEARDDVSLEECMTMARAKTGALMGCACAMGELLASGDRDRTEQVRAFGERLGVAFQLVDDILGIWGEPAVTGKAAKSDLSRRKKSLPVVAALGAEAPEAGELARLYRGADPLSVDQVNRARRLVERSGGRAWSDAEADRQRTRSLEHLDAAGLRGPAAAELHALAHLVTSRDR
ncbi:MAG: geranylgeranyl diphosphate synthase, type [Solirubrobacteraceae bacterium]|nr:geranylgeranyl diphosphate synthase, type [Solirubrobacteraceae bacterium]